jgi:hypothetical protein
VLAGLSLAVWPGRAPRQTLTPPAAESKASSTAPLATQPGMTRPPLSADAWGPPSPAAHDTTADALRSAVASGDELRAREPRSHAVHNTAAEAAKGVRPAAVSDDLRAEMNMLARAEAALRQHDPEAALHELRAHARTFRSGQLQAERTGLRLIALCMQGREPQTTLARYLNSSEDAVLRTRVREACRRTLP